MTDNKEAMLDKLEELSRRLKRDIDSMKPEKYLPSNENVQIEIVKAIGLFHYQTLSYIIGIVEILLPIVKELAKDDQ